MAATFSAGGTRWTVWLLGDREISDMGGRAGVPANGLYFRSADGDERVLALAEHEMHALGDASALTNEVLGVLVDHAVPLIAPPAEPNHGE